MRALTLVGRNGGGAVTRAAALLIALFTCLLLASCGATALADPPGTASGAPSQAGTASQGSGQPGTAVQPAAVDVERIAREATWASGQLRAHFEKHGREGPYATAEAYDDAARETIRNGKHFQYVDRSTNARRNGFYDPPRNRFTAVTDDGRRITTHFRPDNGERYVRGLPRTTYQ